MKWKRGNNCKGNNNLCKMFYSRYTCSTGAPRYVFKRRPLISCGINQSIDTQINQSINQEKTDSVIKDSLEALTHLKH